MISHLQVERVGPLKIVSPIHAQIFIMKMWFCMDEISIITRIQVLSLFAVVSFLK